MNTEETVPRCAQSNLDTVSMFGMTINSVTLSDVFETIDRQIESREPGYILTPNVDHVCEFQESAEFREAYRNGFLILADGMPVLWSGKLLGRPIKEKISGSDLVYWLSEYAARKGYSIFFFGADEGIAQQASEILKEKYPGLKVAGVYSPPMGFDKDPELISKAIRIVKDAKPDICYVALGTPKQDLWCYRTHKQTGVPVQVGVGISLHFVTGDVTRAPLWMQRSSLEWVWRMFQEPRRLVKRYLIRDVKFLPLLWREFWSGRRDKA